MKGTREFVREMFLTALGAFVFVIVSGCSDTQPKGRENADGNNPLGFTRDIKEVFSRYCFECHGAEHKEAELDLRTVKSILTGGESGAAIVPGKPDESILFDMVHDGHMPPEGELPGAIDIERIRRWIALGARP